MRKVTIMGIDYNHIEKAKKLIEVGYSIVLVSDDFKRIENLKNGIYNEEEKKLLEGESQKENLLFTYDLAWALANTNMCHIEEDCERRTTSKVEIARRIGENINQHIFIVDNTKSAVTDKKDIEELIQEELLKRNKITTFEVVANPPLF